MIKRLLIANRGEVAVRIIRACRELGISPVVVYSEADSRSVAVRMADRAVLIGPPPPADSYLRGERIVQAALDTGCTAIHPGFGFLSESADFAERVGAAGLIFVGPSPDSIRAMGLKTEAIARMRRANVPILPGSEAYPAPHPALLDSARAIGYPVLVKAAAGGGGKGMRVVRDEAELLPALESAHREALKAFGDGAIFLEKYIDEARHVEFQVFADQHGNTLHLFERECSVQRRHQKIIEESPSPYLVAHPELRPAMGAAAVSAARAVNYLNAGTVEFIVDARDGAFYFLEMNTRLQVEHPVTEAVTGLDLVRLQLRVAAGEPLGFAQEEVTQRGHAIECRVYAEDPANGFLPSVGKILRAVEPRGPGIRVDTGIATGDDITLHYDPMLAKLIASAERRADAISRMEAALADYVILGPATNLRFLRAVLAHPAFQAGETTTALLDRHFAEWVPPETAPPDAALIAAALAELLNPDPQVPPSRNTRGPLADGDLYSPWERADGFRVGG